MSITTMLLPLPLVLGLQLAISEELHFILSVELGSR